MRWQAAADASCPGQLLMMAAGQDGGNSEMFRKTEENIKKKKKNEQRKQLRRLALKEINMLYSGGSTFISTNQAMASENLDNSSEAGSSSQLHLVTKLLINNELELF